MAYTVAGAGWTHLQLSNAQQVLAGKQQVSHDLRYGRRHGGDDVPGPPGGKHVAPPHDCSHINEHYATANPVRGLVSLPHMGILDTMTAASTKSLDFGRKHMLAAPEREAEQREWSASRFQKSRGAAERWRELTETFEEITGRKQAYPGGWADVEADPQAHLRHGSMFPGGKAPLREAAPLSRPASTPQLRAPSRDLEVAAPSAKSSRRAAASRSQEEEDKVASRSMPRADQDRRFKLLCNTMLKQLRFWRRNAASPEEQRKGVYLHTLMRWIWPGLSPTGLARMHMWVANEEIAKIHFETPPLVSDEERKRMEELFKVLDRKKKGYLTAADLAGGENLDMQEQLKNTIDAATVRVIYGADCKVSLNRFKEIMCEDGYRGHPEATRVLCDNGATGRALKKVVRKVLNYEGWWSEDVAPAEVALRERIDQLELEVIRWRTAAGGGQSARSTQSRPEANNDDKVQGGP